MQLPAATGRVTAGIDIGNTTTEVVLADTSVTPPRPLAWDRSPTRGRKGSAAAAQAAAALVQRVQHRAGLHVVQAVIAPQRPVDTQTAVLARSMPATGRLRLLAVGSTTPGRPGTGAGRPVLVGEPPVRGPADGEGVVLLVPAGTGYQRAAGLVQGWLDAGAPVRAVLVADDEGVLIAHRCQLDGLGHDVPVLDRVDVASAVGTVRLAVEVCPPGGAARQLADPLRLVELLGLSGDDRADAGRLARALVDAPNAVVALAEPTQQHGQQPSPQLTEQPGPEPARFPDGFDAAALDDVWQVDLDRLAAEVELRQGGVPRRFGTAFAGLAADELVPAAELAGLVAAVLDVPVRVAASEAHAARAGALSTSAAGPDALVLDLGGGTLDAVAAGTSGAGGSRGAGAGGEPVACAVAGGGELVAACVAALLDLPRGAAEWVKRGPCGRLETPHVLLGEDGTRSFLERPAPGPAAGSLVIDGPAGWLPFSRTLSPTQWRSLRLRLKRKALGDNVIRAVRQLGEQVDLHPGEVVLVGGVAGDGELLRALSHGPDGGLDAVLPGALVGRADVAGQLGHRWAVAYGLVLLAECDRLAGGS